jgi:hypothetical protein
MDVKLAGLMAQYAYDENLKPDDWEFQGAADRGYSDRQDNGAFRPGVPNRSYEGVSRARPTARRQQRGRNELDSDDS